MGHPGHAVLQVPVPALEGFVRSRTAHYDPGFLGVSEIEGEPFVHAHITVLAPFASPPDRDRVAQGLAGTAPFEVLPGQGRALPQRSAPQSSRPRGRPARDDTTDVPALPGGDAL